jgi:hypothetical protein
MEEFLITRSYLEKLTTYELLVLADSQGIDIPLELERNFIMEEILDGISDHDRFSEEETRFLEEADIPEPVDLPKQYNITYIDIIVRDPLWVYAFWEIKGSDKEIYEKERDFGGYFLRVIPETGHSGNSFTVAVGTGDTGWYLGFSSDLEDVGLNHGKRCFKVELCVDRGEESSVLAASRPFRLPLLLPAPCGKSAGSAGTEIACGGNSGEGVSGRTEIRLLSGLDDISVLRSVERQSRNLQLQK